MNLSIDPNLSTPGNSVAALAPVTLVLGGARSGKSKYGENLIEAAVKPGAMKPLYIATAEAGDAEMAARIDAHKRRRGGAWETVEAPLELTAALIAHDRTARPALVDCLTIWLSNLMAADADPGAGREELIATLGALKGPVVLIANEVGDGIVPANALARAFRDEAGVLNQAVAGAAGRVILMTAGLPLVLKEPGA